jgi:muramoyltetrapeptide carboxypeptidase
MKSWPFLRAGDRVDIIAPASHGPLDRLAKGKAWLEAAGLTVHVPEKLIDPDLFFASELHAQVSQLQDALSSESRAIWCLRGGYGSMRLIPLLKKIRPPTKPKLFVGFSDVTALHLFFQQEWKWPTLHGRTIGQLAVDGNSPELEELRQVLFGEVKKCDYTGLVPLNAAARKAGTIEGTMAGGNLKLLQTSIGTPWELRPQGKLLFIEDVGERGYSIHRMLEQLRQAKLLRPRALLVGDFTEGVEKDGSDKTMDAIQRIADEVDFPVMSGFHSGHHPDRNRPMPLGVKGTLRLGKNPRLTSVLSP